MDSRETTIQTDDGGKLDRFQGHATPARIGRYIILETLGRGGMGVVFAAYDPEIDRKVALKLVRSSRRDDPRLGQRLQREVRAMARVDHRNVVAVHDVGVTGGQLFIAMEYVKGANLREWLAAASRSWQEIHDVLVQSGRGLAEAHRCGIVHRDFKPDNVLVDERGRARVGDFGIARLELESEPEVGLATEKELATYRGRGQEILTAVDARMGTPAYMAPEQLEKAAVDARADQFAFCVTAWEALYDVRPSADTRPRPTNSQVPTWVRLALERGLAKEPERRYESMDALLAALTADPTRRRVLFGVLTVVALAVAGWFTAQHFARERAIESCSERAAEIDSDWNASTRETLAEGMLANGGELAATSLEKTEVWLDRWAGDWSAAREEVCLGRHVYDTWNEADHVAAEDCLLDRREVFIALVGELSEAGKASVIRATTAAATLRSPESCLEPSLLRTRPMMPPDAREQVLVLRSQLAKVEARYLTGEELHRGLDLAEKTLDAAETLGWTPLTAEVRFRVGGLQDEIGDYDKAAATLREAYFEAVESGALEVAAIVACDLSYTLGYRKAQHEDAFLWARLAEVELLQLSVPKEAFLRLRLSNIRAALHQVKGEYELASDLYVEALEGTRAVLGEAHPNVAVILNNLGGVQTNLGQYGEGMASQTKALAIREEVLGPAHPYVADSLESLGVVHYRLGDYPVARSLYERAVTIRERALGKDNPDLAHALVNLGNAERRLGDSKRAESLYRRARSIFETAHGPNHPNVADVLNNHGLLLINRGSFDQARAMLERTLAIREEALGGDHPHVAIALGALVILDNRTGAYRSAREQTERILAINEAKFGSRHLYTSFGLYDMGMLERRLGAPATAQTTLQRALAIQEKLLGSDDPEVADTLGELANATQDLGDLAEARALNERALAIHEAAEETDTEGLATIHKNLGQLARLEKRPDEARIHFLRAVERLAKLPSILEMPVEVHVDALLGLAELALDLDDLDESQLRSEAAMSHCTIGKVPPEVIGRCHFVRARVLWSAGDQPQARTLADEASAAFKRSEAGATGLAALERWRQRHR